MLVDISGEVVSKTAAEADSIRRVAEDKGKKNSQKECHKRKGSQTKRFTNEKVHKKSKGSQKIIKRFTNSQKVHKQ